MANAPADPTLGTTTTIGKYFGVVSTVPSLIAATWLYLLVALQPWQATIDLAKLKTTNPVSQPSHAVALLAFALVVAVVTHPTQFVLIQLLEGYWGLTRPSIALAQRRATTHSVRRARANHLYAKTRPAPTMRAAPGVPPSVAPQPADAETALRRSLIGSASNAIRMSYPMTPENVLPTRLGNVLRAYESRGGQSIGLPVLGWTTYIGMVADTSHTSYVQDQRQELDLAVRMTGVGLLCAVITAAAMWPHGPWLLLALVPYGAAWVSYRGALAAAHAYGQACEAWLYLNRFALYERLHLDLPPTTHDERELGNRLQQKVSAYPLFEENYQHPPSPAAADKPGSPPAQPT